MLLPLILLAAAPANGSFTDAVRRTRYSTLTGRELAEAEWLSPIGSAEVKRCTTMECTNVVEDAFFSSLSEVRSLTSMLPAFAMQVSAIAICRKETESAGRIAVLGQCLQRITSAPAATRMRELGFRQKGVTIAGYGELRTGMSPSEAAFILGSPGQQRSYASSGGYAIEIRQYDGRGLTIIVTFSDRELSSKAQFARR